MELAKNKVLLGLSGGVDSAIAALLLKEKGYLVTGYYFDVLGNNKKGKEDAEALAMQLGIELISEDVSDTFKKIVIDNFCSEYLKGRTPNPCATCNPNVKFKRLIEVADSIGAYYIATGHYARTFFDNASDAFYIRKAANEKKDQSYMLYRLPQNVLSRLIFPLGEILSKDETRNMARSADLINAEKKDSQEICFIDPSDNYVNYIKNAGYHSKPGDFVDIKGNVLGKHQGIVHYTIGQRKGLGIALGKPAFVIRIDSSKNQVVLGDNRDLLDTIVVSSDNFFSAKNPEGFEGKTITAKVRYSAKPATATIKIDDGKVITIFEQPQRASAPGQSIVFYDGDIVLGGGLIE